MLQVQALPPFIRIKIYKIARNYKMAMSHSFHLFKAISFFDTPNLDTGPIGLTHYYNIYSICKYEVT